MKHKQRKTVNERRRKKKSIRAVCGEWLWRARESSAVGVWAEEWQPRVKRVSTEQGASLAMESHLLAEEGSHSGKCFNSQTAHPDSSHGPSVVHSGIYVCPFLLSPSSIRLIFVRFWSGRQWPPVKSFVIGCEQSPYKKKKKKKKK